MDGFFRNGEGDEVIFVHEGSGTVESIFGELPYKPGDYVVIPRGTTYRFVPDDGEQRYVVFESPGLIEIPRRYRNEYGQLLEHAPYYHRDIHPPTELNTHRERGEFHVKVRVRGGYQTYVLDYHPFDVVGWDGYVYPWTFSIHDFEPITGRIHMPPPSHQTFQGRNFVICSFCPRKLDFDPHGDPDPVSPLEPEQRGDDLLRRRELRVAEGDRDRLGDAASVGDPARAGARPRGEVDRDDGDARARGDVRHVPSAAADEAREGARRRQVLALVVRGPGAGRRRPTRIPPASRAISDARARAARGALGLRGRVPAGGAAARRSAGGVAPHPRVRRRVARRTASSSGRNSRSFVARATCRRRRTRGAAGRRRLPRGRDEAPLRRRARPTVEEVARLHPPLPRPGPAVQGDRRPAPRAADGRRARLPEPARRLRLRRRGGDAGDAGDRARRGLVSRRRAHAPTQRTCARVRRELFASIGSCSFDEPVGELRALGIL